MVDFLFPESRENLPTNFNKIIPLTNRDKWRTKHYTCRAVSEAINLCNTNTHTHTHTHTHQFYDPFSSTIQVSQCQKKSSSGFYGAREDKQRQTHRPSSWAPLHPDQSAPTGCWLVWMEWRPAGPPTSIIPPPFLRQIPFLPQPSHFILAWDRHQICWIAYPVALWNTKYVSIQFQQWMMIECQQATSSLSDQSNCLYAGQCFSISGPTIWTGCQIILGTPNYLWIG